MLKDIKPDQLPCTVAVIMDRVAESRLLEDFDLDFALSNAHASMEAGTGAVFVDNDVDPTCVLWVVKSRGFFFKHYSAFVILITTLTDTREGSEPVRKAMAMLKIAEDWGRNNGCKSVTVSSWINEGGPDITPLLERWGARLQEKTHVKAIT